MGHMPFWPESASTTAANVDALYIFLLTVSAIMTLMIFCMLIIFAVRFRKRKGQRAEQIEGSVPLEITWSIIPFCVMMVFFVWGAVIYFQERTPPQDALEVYTVAKQWMWKFEHKGGQREINELHVPVGRDIKMIHDLAGCNSQFFCAGLSPQAGRAAGALYDSLVPRHQTGHLSPVLFAVLRNAALGNDRLGGGDGAERL